MTQMSATLRPAAVITPQSLLGRGIVIVCAIALLTASAKVAVPFWPVPQTLQTLAVLLIAASLDRSSALASVAGYLGLGAAGLPMFASGAGLAYMTGPTGGYLAGFLLATALIASLRRQFPAAGPLALAAILLSGTVVMLGLGVAHLATLVGVDAAIANGLLPFLAGEATKIALAAALLVAAGRIKRHG